MFANNHMKHKKNYTVCDKNNSVMINGACNIGSSNNWEFTGQGTWMRNLATHYRTKSGSGNQLINHDSRNQVHFHIGLILLNRDSAHQSRLVGVMETWL